MGTWVSEQLISQKKKMNHPADARGGYPFTQSLLLILIIHSKKFDNQEDVCKQVE
jgi:hypothetical protein